MVGLIRVEQLITHLRIHQFSSTIPDNIFSFWTYESGLWICFRWWTSFPFFLSAASGHLIIDLIGKTEGKEQTTAGIRLHQLKIELSNHGLLALSGWEE